MREFFALLLGFFLVAAGAGAVPRTAEAAPLTDPSQASQNPETADAPGTPDAPLVGEAAYQFALAKLLLQEGSLAEAVNAFQRAIELAPDEPYVRIELAQLLSHLAQSQRDPAARQRQQNRAVEQIRIARDLAPENLDVLRSFSQLYLSMADSDPEALASAMEALEKIRQREPWDLQAMVALGQIRMARGEVAEAADVFEEAVDYTPNHRILYGFLADAAERAGDDQRAGEALEKILELDPLDVETRIRVAELKGRQEDHDGALAVLTELPEGIREEVRLRYLKARELLMTDEPGQALEIISKLDQEDLPDRLRFFLTDLRGRVLVRLGRNEEAAAEVRSLLDLDSTSSDTVRNVTSQLVQMGREDDAVAALGTFIEKYEGAGRAEGQDDNGQRQAVETARLALAALQVDREEWDAAVAALEPLLGSEDSERRITGIVNTAEVLYQAGRTDDALELLRAREKDDPILVGKQAELLLRAGDDGRARRLLKARGKSSDPQIALAAVRAFQGQQRYAETLGVLTEVVKRHPSVESYFLLGAAEERTGDVDSAAQTFQRLLQLEPDHAPTLNYLGYMWAEQGTNLENALGMVQRAVEIDPHNGAYADSLGWAHYRLGNYEEARSHLERAARLVPGDPVIYEHLGDVYSALGERLKAAESYRRALQVAGEDGGQDVDLNVVRRKLDQVSGE